MAKMDKSDEAQDKAMMARHNRLMHPDQKSKLAHGGKVHKMAEGGKVSRGAGAAIRGFKYHIS